MDIELLELLDGRAKFILSNSSPEMANSLRRVLISEIPVMAIETVDFHLGPISDEEDEEYESISPLFDEIVAHRLGLIPIPTDLSLFSFRDECECGGEGCPNCTVMYSLNKKGPSEVFSGDLEPLGPDEFRVNDELIPIVKLGEGQALLVYASAELGTGAQHAKWQATSGVGYKYYPHIDIDASKCDLCESCITICPKEVLAESNGKIVVENLEDCSLCKSCVESCESDAITVKGDRTKLIFEFETNSAITAAEALDKALKIMIDKYDTFRELVSDLDT